MCNLVVTSNFNHKPYINNLEKEFEKKELRNLERSNIT